MTPNLALARAPAPLPAPVPVPVPTEMLRLLVKSPVAWRILGNWYREGAIGKLDPAALLAHPGNKTPDRLRTDCREQVFNPCHALNNIEANTDLDPLGVPRNRSILTKQPVAAFSERLLSGLQHMPPTMARLVALGEEALIGGGTASSLSASEREALQETLSVLRDQVNSVEVARLREEIAQTPSPRKFGTSGVVVVETLRVDPDSGTLYNYRPETKRPIPSKEIAPKDYALPPEKYGESKRQAGTQGGAAPEGRKSAPLSNLDFFSQHPALLSALQKQHLLTRKDFTDALIKSGIKKATVLGIVVDLAKSATITDKRGQLSKYAILAAKIAGIPTELAFPEYVARTQRVNSTARTPKALQLPKDKKVRLSGESKRGRKSAALSDLSFFTNHPALLSALQNEAILTRTDLIDGLIAQGAGKKAATATARKLIEGVITDKRSGQLSLGAVRMAKSAGLTTELAFPEYVAPLQNTQAVPRAPRRAGSLNAYPLFKDQNTALLEGLSAKQILTRTRLEEQLIAAGAAPTFARIQLSRLLKGDIINNKTGKLLKGAMLLAQIAGLEPAIAYPGYKYAKPQIERPRYDRHLIARLPSLQNLFPHVVAALAGKGITHTQDISRQMKAAGLDKKDQTRITTQLSKGNLIDRAGNPRQSLAFLIRLSGLDAAAVLTRAAPPQPAYDRSQAPTWQPRFSSEESGPDFGTAPKQIVAGLEAAGYGTRLSLLNRLREHGCTEGQASKYIAHLVSGNLSLKGGGPNPAMKTIAAATGLPLPGLPASGQTRTRAPRLLSDLTEPALKPYVEGLRAAGIETTTRLTKAIVSAGKSAPVAYGYTAQFAKGKITKKDGTTPSPALRLIASLAKVPLPAQPLSQSALKKVAPAVIAGLSKKGVTSFDQLHQEVEAQMKPNGSCVKEALTALLGGRVIDPATNMPSPVALCVSRIAGVPAWRAFKTVLQQQLEAIAHRPVAVPAPSDTLSAA